MEVLMFFLYAMIVFLLVLLLGGTLIGYYFQKKIEYDIRRVGAVCNSITAAKNAKKE